MPSEETKSVARERLFDRTTKSVTMRMENVRWSKHDVPQWGQELKFLSVAKVFRMTELEFWNEETVRRCATEY